MAAGELTQEQRYLADTLIESGAFKVGAFKLKLHETNPNAPLSPYYISMREKDVVPGTFPVLCQRAATAMHADTIHLVDRIDFVIGIPRAGDPLAGAYSAISHIPLLRMEKYESSEGRSITSLIHGNFKGGKVLGIDDLITAADTKLEFQEGVEANRLILVHIAVGLDREQGGVQRLRQAGVNISASLTISKLLEYYLGSGAIDEQSFRRIKDYIKRYD